MLAARPEANGRRKVSLEAYDRMWKAGEFEARRVELLDGEVVEMSPMGTPHAEALRRLTRHLVLALVDLPRLAVDVQIPVRIPNYWEPVPDFSVTTKLPSPRPGAAPEGDAEVKLVIEVSASTLKDDLGQKAAAYALGEFPEYWVIDLNAKVAIVHREPKAGRYTSIDRTPWTSRLESSAVPGLTVTLSEVLW